MPFNLDFLRGDTEEAQQERLEARDAINLRMLEIHKDLDVLETEGARFYEALLDKEQKDAFTDIMNGDASSVMLARERARLCKRLLQIRPDREEELASLARKRDGLEEEEADER